MLKLIRFETREKRSFSREHRKILFGALEESFHGRVEPEEPGGVGFVAGITALGSVTRSLL
ncbi:hypothetical protein [Methanoregula formicica]|uniref:hypothetical protein n=1 Tax=Methanoregula formicica TaxID=882104 RepID=UPI00064F0183|nr:hypothetical protein [Methanoregula formicica]